MRLIEGLDQSECAAQLGDPEFIRSLAAIAIHTRDTNCEGGFPLYRSADGIQVGQPVMPKGAHENGGTNPKAAMNEAVLFRDNNQAAALIHTHPVRRFGNDNRLITRDEILSLGDLQHMRRQQRGCSGYILGMMRKDMTHPKDDNKVVLDLYRSVALLPEDDWQLLGEYEWAAGRDFKHELEQSLGVKSARFGFDIVESSVHPNALWGDHQVEVAKLYADSPSPR